MKTVGDSFVIAFGSLVNAVRFSLQLQLSRVFDLQRSGTNGGVMRPPSRTPLLPQLVKRRDALLGVLLQQRQAQTLRVRPLQAFSAGPHSLGGARRGSKKGQIACMDKIARDMLKPESDHKHTRRHTEESQTALTFSGIRVEGTEDVVAAERHDAVVALLLAVVIIVLALSGRDDGRHVLRELGTKVLGVAATPVGNTRGNKPSFETRGPVKATVERVRFELIQGGQSLVGTLLQTLLTQTCAAEDKTGSLGNVTHRCRDGPSGEFRALPQEREKSDERVQGSAGEKGNPPPKETTKGVQEIQYMVKITNI